MSFRVATRRASALAFSSKARQSALFTRRITYYQEQDPYDPEQDPTPRRKYIFGGAAIIGMGTMLVLSILRPAKSDTDDSAYRVDPDTDVSFPTTLQLPETPPLTLLGLGVRTVSFLGLKVYSVGFYADLGSSDRPVVITTNATPDDQIQELVRSTTCALRIVPVRSTSHTHLRDGFVRSLQSRINLARQNGYLTPQQEDALLQPVQIMKGLFPNTPLPKHKPLHVVLTAPDARTGGRSLFFPELGRVDDAWVANEFFLAYFSGKGISPAMKKSVEDAIAKEGGWSSARIVDKHFDWDVKTTVKKNVNWSWSTESSDK